MGLTVELLGNLAAVDPTAWDAIAGDDDPFVEHGFLRALESSGSVGDGSGWNPVHVTVREGGRLVGQSIWDWFPSIQRGRLHLMQTLADGKRFRGAESVITRLDGSVVPIGISCTPLTDADGAKLVIRRRSHESTFSGFLPKYAAGGRDTVVLAYAFRNSLGK